MRYGLYCSMACVFSCLDMVVRPGSIAPVPGVAVKWKPASNIIVRGSLLTCVCCCAGDDSGEGPDQDRHHHLRDHPQPHPLLLQPLRPPHDPAARPRCLLRRERSVTAASARMHKFLLHYMLPCCGPLYAPAFDMPVKFYAHCTTVLAVFVQGCWAQERFSLGKNVQFNVCMCAKCRSGRGALL